MLSTGTPVLDDALSGGLPEGRTTLVTGGPGTGKSTLAMQFVQEGIEKGESALFVSTEQTHEELRDSFEDFEFDLSHDRLTVTSIRAARGTTIEGGDEDEIVIETVDGGDMLGGGYSAPFKMRYLTEYLQQQQDGPVDRIVFDSVSGMRVIEDSGEMYRQSVLELINFFDEEMDATSVITSEEIDSPMQEGGAGVSPMNAVQFKTHGVIRLWRENVNGDYHRYVEVKKMRGVDHDTRVYELEFDQDGVRIIPRYRTHSRRTRGNDFLRTGIEGLDELLGGGLILGGTSLLQHDGQAGIYQIVSEAVLQAFRGDMAVVLVPPVEFPPKRFRRIFDRRKDGEGMDELMKQDRLFLVDFPNIWQNTKRNVFKPFEKNEDIRDVYRTIKDRSGDRPLFSLINIEAMTPGMSEDEIRKARFWEEENFFGERDTSLYLFNPNTVEDTISEFYKNGAWQMLDTWVNERGLQYVELKKSPVGYLGSTRNVEYLDEEPYLRVQHPPKGGEGR